MICHPIDVPLLLLALALIPRIAKLLILLPQGQTLGNEWIPRNILIPFLIGIQVDNTKLVIAPLPLPVLHDLIMGQIIQDFQKYCIGAVRV